MTEVKRTVPHHELKKKGLDPSGRNFHLSIAMKDGFLQGMGSGLLEEAPSPSSKTLPSLGTKRDL